MLKTKSKFIALFITILLILSTTVFASDTEVMPISEDGTITSTDTNSVDATNENTTTDDASTPEITNNDVYIFDSNIEMNQLVDGNVFLMGNNVNITGRVNGCLYVMAENVTFGAESYVVNSAYVLANRVTIEGAANDFYVAANTVDMLYNGFAIRDLKLIAQTFNFSGGVGRNAYVDANQFNFDTTTDASGIVYGDLTYTSSNELSLSEGLVEGTTTYTPALEETNSVTDFIMEKAINFCNALLIALVVFFLTLWLAPKFIETAGSYISVKKGFLSLGIGILSIIVALAVIIGLLFSIVGSPLSLIILGLLVLMLLISFAITCTTITYKLKEKLSYKKNYLTYITFVVTVLVIWLLQQIPYAGSIISLIVTLFGFGVVVNYLLFKNHVKKQLTNCMCHVILLMHFDWNLPWQIFN